MENIPNNYLFTQWIPQYGIVRSPADLNNNNNIIGGEQSVYFAQEMLKGESLNSVILAQMVHPHSNLYSNQQALKWAVQLSSALSYLHERKQPILHRDLNCKNILLDSKNFTKASLKIIDFGLHTVLTQEKLQQNFGSAKSTKSDLSSDDYNQPQQGTFLTQEVLRSQQEKNLAKETNDFQNVKFKPSFPDNVNFPIRNKTVSFVDESSESGSSVGFFHRYLLTGNTGCYMYMAPEVINSENYNEKCDIYSLGCILYEIFCRRLRIFDVHYDLTEERIQQYAWKMASGFRPAITAHLNEQIKDIISDCWDQNPDKRPSAKEVAHRFQELLDDQVEPRKKSLWGCFYP